MRNLFRESNEEVWMYVDESYYKKYISVGVVCIQGKYNHDLIIEQTRKMSLDPSVNIFSTDTEYHYVDMSIGARQSIAGWVSKMPISAYESLLISEHTMSKNEMDTMVYEKMFGEILKPLFEKFQKRFGLNTKINILFENLSDKPEKDKVFFSNCLYNLNLKGVWEISIATKKADRLIFLPDFFLGYTKDCLAKEVQGTWPRDLMKILSEKIGLIHYSIEGETKRYIRGESIYTFLC